MTRAKILGFLLLLTILRCVWVYANPVAPSETYFWLCSERLAPAFFDGPAATAYVVRAFDGLDVPTLLAVRLFWPVMAFVVGWLTWQLGLKFTDAKGAAWLVLLLNSLPHFNREAVTVGPTLPALLCVLGGVLAVRAAWEGGGLGSWVLAGLAFAMGVGFRYEVVLVPMGLCFAALLSRRHRRPADLLGMACIGILMGIVSMPALIWNAGLEWIPIAGGTFRTAWQVDVAAAGRELGLFFLGFSPVIALASLLAIVGIVRLARTHERARFLLAACAPAWLWWGYLCLRGEPAVAVSLPAFVPLAAFALAESAKWRFRVPVLVLATVVGIVGSVHLLAQDSHSRHEWPVVAAALREASRDLPASESGGFLIAERPMDAAVLTYYLRASMGAVFAPESPDLAHQMGLWPGYGDFVESDVVVDEFFTEQKGTNPNIGRSALFLGDELPQTIKAAFVSVVPLRTIAIQGRQPLMIYLCLDYQTMPL